MITAYKMDPAFLAAKQAEYASTVGDKPLLPVFVAQTAKVLLRDRKAYLRYGPYWWSVKRILRAGGVDVGSEDFVMWADEYDCETPELTLIAAWAFADDASGQFGVQTREYDLDGIDFVLYDGDVEEPK